MFCKKCGNNLADNITFCNRCGEKTGGAVNSNDNTINIIPNFIDGNNNNSIAIKSKPNLKVLAPVMGGILLTLVIVLTVFMVTVAKDKNIATAKTAITETLNNYSGAMSNADLEYAVTFWVDGKRNTASSLAKIVDNIPYGSGILELLTMVADVNIIYDISFSKDDIIVEGDSASVAATVSFSIPGYLDISSQQTTFQLVKQDGKWLIDSARKGKAQSSR